MKYVLLMILVLNTGCAHIMAGYAKKKAGEKCDELYSENVDRYECRMRRYAEINATVSEMEANQRRYAEESSQRLREAEMERRVGDLEREEQKRRFTKMRSYSFD